MLTVMINKMVQIIPTNALLKNYGAIGIFNKAFK